MLNNSDHNGNKSNIIKIITTTLIFAICTLLIILTVLHRSNTIKINKLRYTLTMKDYYYYSKMGILRNETGEVSLDYVAKKNLFLDRNDFQKWTINNVSDSFKNQIDEHERSEFETFVEVNYRNHIKYKEINDSYIDKLLRLLIICYKGDIVKNVSEIDKRFILMCINDIKLNYSVKLQEILILKEMETTLQER